MAIYHCSIKIFSRGKESAERRQKTLAEHIKHAEYYLQFRDVHGLYKQQKPNKQETFKESNSREIILFEAAETYLKQHMNGHKTLPIKSWKSEAAKLKTEKDNIYQQFTSNNVNSVYRELFYQFGCRPLYSTKSLSLQKNNVRLFIVLT